jgi:hypothetical protein
MQLNARLATPNAWSKSLKWNRLRLNARVLEEEED